MYDYVDGKADWMAYGLPVEGTDGPFLGEVAAAIPTCDVGLSVSDARRHLDASGAAMAVVVSAGGLAVGEVDRGALDAAAGDAQLLEVLRPVPSTVRPSVAVASVADAGGGDRLVTTSDGRLVGMATIEAVGHHEHDHEHEGHDQGGSSLDMERYEQELAEVMTAVQERFGDREPSARELRALLHERLVAEGRTAEEAERYLDDLGIGDAG